MVQVVPSLLVGVTIAAATFAFAGEAAPKATSPSEPAVPPILAAPSQPDKALSAAPARPRAISPAVATILASAMPKYNPDAPKPQGVLNLAKSDEPRNDIIRLPEYIVTERRPPVLTERKIYTREALRELAFRRYIPEFDRALNRFTLPLFGISAQERAMQMYEEDERLRNMRDMADTARIVSLTDGEAGMYIKRVAEQTYMRKSDFGWNGGRAANSRP
jgi:hypothetical protein